jgi:hypothetical protein
MNTAPAFEAGKSYYTRSLCDWDCIIRITVAKRTAKTLTTTEGKRLGIRLYEGVEQVKPWGSYSMNPIISANREG